MIFSQESGWEWYGMGKVLISLVPCIEDFIQVLYMFVYGLILSLSYNLSGAQNLGKYIVQLCSKRFYISDEEILTFYLFQLVFRFLVSFQPH